MQKGAPPPAPPLPPPPPGPATAARAAGKGKPAPYYFLTWEQLAGFYRNPHCGGYYYPPADEAAEAATESYVVAHGAYPLCSDTEWSLYAGEAQPVVGLHGIDR